MPEKSSSDYLRILEESVSEHRTLKERAADEYRRINEAFALAEDELNLVEAEYEPFSLVLEPLQDRRHELNQNIQNWKRQKSRLEKELARISEELEQFENEVEPMRKEITTLMNQTKPLRDRRKQLTQKIYQLEKQRGEARQRLKEAQNAFSESNQQYLLALQWEKRKPLIIVTGLTLLFVVVLAAIVWAANQMSIISFLPVIIATFLVFSMIVITLLRQDEKLREESYVQLVREILKYLHLVRQ